MSTCLRTNRLLAFAFDAVEQREVEIPAKVVGDVRAGADCAESAAIVQRGKSRSAA